MNVLNSTVDMWEDLSITVDQFLTRIIKMQNHTTNYNQETQGMKPTAGSSTLSDY